MFSEQSGTVMDNQFHNLNVSTLSRVHPQGHLIPIVSVLLLSSYVKLFAIED